MISGASFSESPFSSVVGAALLQLSIDYNIPIEHLLKLAIENNRIPIEIFGQEQKWLINYRGTLWERIAEATIWILKERN